MTLSSDRADILQMAHWLEPIQLELRFSRYVKFGLSYGSDSEVVTQSFGHPMPVDAKGNGGDGFDRVVFAAQRAYRDAVAESRRQLMIAMAIQTEWLKDPRPPTKKERALASDSGVDCKRCLRPVACTPADKLLAGMCRSCYTWWVRNGRPDIIRIVPEEEQPKRVKVAP